MDVIRITLERGSAGALLRFCSIVASPALWTDSAPHPEPPRQCPRDQRDRPHHRAGARARAPRRGRPGGRSRTRRPLRARRGAALQRAGARRIAARARGRAGDGAAGGRDAHRVRRAAAVLRRSDRRGGVDQRARPRLRRPRRRVGTHPARARRVRGARSRRADAAVHRPPRRPQLAVRRRLAARRIAAARRHPGHHPRGAGRSTSARFRAGMRDLRELVRLGSLTSQAAGFLHVAVRSGCNILVSGATQSGKTTLLGALLASSRPEERIVTVEETFELAVGNADTVAMQCRQPSLEGTGEVTLRRLIKEALRMRPDRLVVGEVREAESLDLLIALNSGLPGHVLAACQQRPRRARQAVHAAVARGSQHRLRVRRADRRLVGRPRRARRVGARRPPPRHRDRRADRRGRGRGRGVDVALRPARGSAGGLGRAAGAAREVRAQRGRPRRAARPPPAASRGRPDDARGRASASRWAPDSCWSPRRGSGRLARVRRRAGSTRSRRCGCDCVRPGSATSRREPC